MNERGFWQLDGVSDDNLTGALKALVMRGARTDARVVAHLAEVEARSLHLRSADSLFEYCQKCLGLSRSEAFYRIVAARLGRSFPVVFELLESRQAHLTSLPLIRDYITADNHAELLREISGKTKEQILVILATRVPRPDAKSHIRRLPVTARSVAAGPTGTLEPLSAQSYLLQLHTSATLKAKLELAADLMSHANPQRDLAVVVERGLDLLIERLQQRRFGASARSIESESTPHEQEAPAGARKRTHIPRAVRRQLIERDGLGCTFVCDDGQRCGARAFLQIHHDEAWARGGSDELANLRLVCEAHNRLLAEDELGRERVRAAISRRRGRAA